MARHAVCRDGGGRDAQDTVGSRRIGHSSHLCSASRFDCRRRGEIGCRTHFRAARTSRRTDVMRYVNSWRWWA